MIFLFQKTTKNYHKYVEVGGINTFYVPKETYAVPPKKLLITYVEASASHE